LNAERVVDSTTAGSAFEVSTKENRMPEKTHSLELNVDGTPTVQVGNIRGSITITPGPDGLVSIQAVERGSSDRTRVELRQDADGVIHARTEYDKTIGMFTGFVDKPNKVDYTVTIPANTHLTAGGVTSSVDVRGITGDVRLKTVSGKMVAVDVSGELALESVSGRITAARLSGPTEVRTVSGSVALTGSDLPSLHANSVSGNVELETPIGPGPYKFKTVSGTVRVRSADAPAGRVNFKSLSGAVSVNGKRLHSPHRRPRPGPGKTAIYDLGGEGPEIQFSSVSGSLKLFSEDYVLDATPAGTEAVPEPARPEMMDLLERISSGEMTVDEAVDEISG
jgi:hypothetical protein